MPRLTFEDLIKEEAVTDAKGDSVPLHSNTSLEQCRFLQRIIQEIDASRCLEIGLAYGVSALAIGDAIREKDEASLIAIDPFQERDWDNIGLLNLERAGFLPFTRFHSDSADQVLPSLLQEGETIDFAYVDASKVFDIVLMQSHYLFQLTRIGGVVVFDDCGFPGVARAVRWMASLPHISLFKTHGRLKFSPLRNLASKTIRFVPGRDRIFRRELLESPACSSNSATCVVLRKTGEDDRPWDWDFSL